MKAEKHCGTVDYTELSMWPGPPDSDYGSEGWGFEFLRAC
jgi:hypothetical protein